MDDAVGNLVNQLLLYLFGNFLNPSLLFGVCQKKELKANLTHLCLSHRLSEEIFFILSD